MSSTTSIGSMAVPTVKATRVRYAILGLLFLVTAINYADRATLSIAGTALARELNFDPIGMGYLFSAFGWAYVIGQIPGGWLLDRYGSKLIYGLSLFSWSLFTLLQGGVGFFHPTSAFVMLFAVRFALGLVESPAFPANNRIVAAWFPTAERGTATAIFNSAQYAAVAFFAPIMGWITASFGWEYIFLFMGALGILLSLAWPWLIHNPKDHPRANAAEIEHLEKGGALVDMDRAGAAPPVKIRWAHVKQLLSHRLLLGAYAGQYAITALTYFFITWFPIYLVQARGMSIMKVGFVAALPAICGFLGGVCSGMLSDALLRRGISLSAARKTPFVIGMALATTLVACNVVAAEWAVIAIMALAFFGKGLAAIGWAVISDAAPREITGLTGGMFNAIGNIAGIVTPIVSGYIIVATGSYDGVLVFVAAHAVLAILAYLFLMGPIHRLTLRQA
ncbi:MFS transporter [Roseomonas gilardii]|uniref:Glucarate transporter n=1 Tax=Roseomonas gilardii TaxID=257708 RepID=A0A1L7AKI8_9PROT|nr:MFS transporter [Roseomonas gilardii]APT59297.1 glucarate transporter [Roseomonas gilardii]MDT8333521.1 MFS transporter [Roseomonas gilardii]